jgi:hypothetical protein
MARAMLSTVAGMQVGCLIPPDLEPASQDAGGGSPPVIRSAQPAEFAFPGPILLEHGDTRQLSLEVEDGDREDTIFVQLYVDYNRPPTNAPTPAYASCQAAPTEDTIRLIPCSTASLCNSIATTDDTPHVLEAMAADRSFILDSDPQAEDQPPYRALAQPQEASFTISSWVMSCQTTTE